MIFADTIKEKNIVEYILYMWQTEDIVRAFNLDIHKIETNVISTIQANSSEKEKIKSWYSQLIKDLKLQGKTNVGHHNNINEIIVELNYLHNSLINLMQDATYSDLYKKALPFINDFRRRPENEDLSEIQLCLVALYGKLILKLKGLDISQETEAAINQFRNVLAYLSVKYKEMKLGKLNL